MYMYMYGAMGQTSSFLLLVQHPKLDKEAISGCVGIGSHRRLVILTCL